MIGSSNPAEGFAPLISTTEDDLLLDEFRIALLVSHLTSWNYQAMVIQDVETINQSNLIDLTMGHGAMMTANARPEFKQKFDATFNTYVVAACAVITSGTQSEYDHRGMFDAMDTDIDKARPTIWRSWSEDQKTAHCDGLDIVHQSMPFRAMDDDDDE